MISCLCRQKETMKADRTFILSCVLTRLRPYKTVSFDELTEKIASHSGLTKGNILAVMEEIEYWTKQLLSDGYRVQIGNIGTVSASLKADAEVYDKEDIHAQSIRFDKVKVTVSKQFSKQCGGKVLRAPSEEIPAKFVHVYGGRAARLASIVSGEPRLYHPCGIWHFDGAAEIQSLAGPGQMGESAPYRHQGACSSPGVCEA